MIPHRILDWLLAHGGGRLLAALCVLLFAWAGCIVALIAWALGASAAGASLAGVTVGGIAAASLGGRCMRKAQEHDDAHADRAESEDHLEDLQMTVRSHRAVTDHLRGGAR